MYLEEYIEKILVTVSDKKQYRFQYLLHILEYNEQLLRLGINTLLDKGFIYIVNKDRYDITGIGEQYLISKNIFNKKHIPFTPSVINVKLSNKEPLKRIIINIFKQEKKWVGVEDFKEIITNIDEDLCIDILKKMHDYHIIKKHPRKGKYKICTKDEIIEAYILKIGV